MSSTTYVAGKLVGTIPSIVSWGSLKQTSSSADTSFLLQNNTNLIFGINNIEQFRVNTSGFFGLGTQTPGVKLDVVGAIRATGAITALYSDKRLKTNVKPIKNALDKVNVLSGVYYTQNKLAETFGYNDYSQQVGVFAQDVEKVLPEAVQPAPFDMDENNESKTGENYLTVQYERLIPLLIESIKELNQKVIDLEQEVVILRGN